MVIHFSHTVTYDGQCGSRTASVCMKRYENKSLSHPGKDLKKSGRISIKQWNMI